MSLMTWRRSRSAPPPTENGRKLSPSTAPKTLPCGVLMAAIFMGKWLTFKGLAAGGRDARKALAKTATIFNRQPAFQACQSHPPRPQHRLDRHPRPGRAALAEDVVGAGDLAGDV